MVLSVALLRPCRHLVSSLHHWHGNDVSAAVALPCTAPLVR